MDQIELTPENLHTCNEQFFLAKWAKVPFIFSVPSFIDKSVYKKTYNNKRKTGAATKHFQNMALFI